MHRTSWLAVAAIVTGGCSSSSTTVWVHPERSETEMQADLAACQAAGENSFESEESQALVHGDFSTYGTLTDERRRMVAECMTARGWTARTIRAAAPADTRPAPSRASSGAASQTPAVSAPAASAPAAAPATATSPTPVAAETPEPTAPDVPGAATAAPAPAPVPAQPGSGSERSADRAACEAEAEAAVEDAMGDALSHGDLGAYERLRARRDGIIEGCMMARGWRDEPGS